jgi:NADH:ubiquinone reductase (H+-translocating)
MADMAESVRMPDGEGRHGPRHVVIVGGGFGGLFAARALRRAPVSVTLVDRAPHHLFQPLLYQCATGILSEGQIAAPLRSVLKRHKNVQCVMAQVTGIDVDGRRLSAVRPGGGVIEFGYDDLIVAAGMRQSYFGHDEFARFAPGMKTISDALTIRRRVFGAFEMAETSDDPAERRRWLTFALVGAGPTGVELAGQIRELATKTLRAEYRNAKPEEARVLLFDGGDAPLAAFGETLSAKVTKELGKLGVEMHMGSLVTDVDATGLVVRDRAGATTRYDVGVVLWTAGVEAPAFAEALANATGAERDRAGRILVQPDLTIPGHPEISVIGDLMSLDKLPGVAEVAMQGGLYAGHRIGRAAEGRETEKPFRYHDLGSAAYISRGNAVMSAGPLKISGFPGWVGWLFIHIAFLTGYRNRLGAILTWWSAFTRDRRRERAFTTREVGVVADLYTAVIPAARPAEPTAPAEQAPPAQPTAPAQPAAPGEPKTAPRRAGS